MKTQNITVSGIAYTAIRLTRDQITALDNIENIDSHSFLSECSREKWKDEGTEIPAGCDIIDITGHGNEPLGLILRALNEVGVDWNTAHEISDVGYDTDVDRVGINSIFAVVEVA